VITHKKYLNYLSKQVEAGLGAGSTLVVAVSGGGDSVALLHGLAALRESLGLELVVGHLDHGLRADSADDAAFVAGLGQQLGLMCVQECHDVGKQVAAEAGNLENVARRIRYGMLESVGRAVEADAIVVAHTADDQAETMLMHLLRGAGLDGLKGMTTFAPSPIPAAQTPIFRPLLLVEREVLREWLRAEGHAWREDATNADTTRFRSRLRHEIIPLLAQEQPHLRTFMARTAQLLSADNAWLAEQTEAAWQAAAILYEKRRSICLERNAFLAQPLALRRRLLRRAFFHVAPSATELSYEQTTAALKVASIGKSGAQATLPGHLFLFVEYDKLWIGTQIDHSDALTLTTSIPLPDLGSITAQGLSITLSQVGRQALPNDWRTHPSHIAFLDKGTLQRPLQLRPPQANDYWAPLGMKGQEVYLRDWMAKQKVPLAQRDKTPLLEDDKGRILWVGGWQVGETARVRKESQEVVQVVGERG
jgi:tRNA(Ile)-lysidine synthase